jgi:RNA polymerase sigma-70 factor (ECF subfamily)
MIERAQAGDRLSLDRLLCRHASRLKQHLTPRLPDVLKGVVDVDDILQQTFLQVFRDFQRFESQGPGSFYAWMRGIAENRLYDCVRQQKRKKRGGDFRRQITIGEGSVSSAVDLIDQFKGPGATPSQSVARSEMMAAIRQSVSDLPRDQRDAIQYYCLEGRSLEETAEIMGRTTGAIRALIHRGKVRLQEQIDRSSM